MVPDFALASTSKQLLVWFPRPTTDAGLPRPGNLVKTAFAIPLGPGNEVLRNADAVEVKPLSAGAVAGYHRIVRL